MARTLVAKNHKFATKVTWPCLNQWHCRPSLVQPMRRQEKTTHAKLDWKKKKTSLLLFCRGSLHHHFQPTPERVCVWVCSIKGANSSACKMIHNNPSTVSFMWRHNPLFTFQNHFFQICDICDIVELQRSKGLILFVLLDGYTYNKNGVWTKEPIEIGVPIENLRETSYADVAESLKRLE